MLGESARTRGAGSSRLTWPGRLIFGPSLRLSELEVLLFERKSRLDYYFNGLVVINARSEQESDMTKSVSVRLSSFNDVISEN